MARLISDYVNLPEGGAAANTQHSPEVTMSVLEVRRKITVKAANSRDSHDAHLGSQTYPGISTDIEVEETVTVQEVGLRTSTMQSSLSPASSSVAPSTPQLSPSTLRTDVSTPTTMVSTPTMCRSQPLTPSHAAASHASLSRRQVFFSGDPIEIPYSFFEKSEEPLSANGKSLVQCHGFRKDGARCTINLQIYGGQFKPRWCASTRYYGKGLVVVDRIGNGVPVRWSHWCWHHTDQVSHLRDYSRNSAESPSPNEDVGAIATALQGSSEADLTPSIPELVDSSESDCEQHSDEGDVQEPDSGESDVEEESSQEGELYDEELVSARRDTERPASQSCEPQGERSSSQGYSDVPIETVEPTSNEAKNAGPGIEPTTSIRKLTKAKVGRVIAKGKETFRRISQPKVELKGSLRIDFRVGSIGP